MGNLKILLFSIILFFAACTKLNDEVLFGDTNQCDTSAVSYKSDLFPILQNNCLFCHNQQNHLNAGAGINLEGYSKVKSMASSGRLVGSIAHSPGFSPMPKNSPQLQSCQIAKIKAWVNQGMKNN